MNNEPVAWIIQSKYGLPALVWNGEPIKYATVVKQADIPLYTHPAKTLTDEEIMDEWWHETSNGFEIYTDTPLAFAKAILRKAQEK